MTEHTYRDTTWRASLMGSEGWAVFAGPRMLASHLTEEQARLIAAAPEMRKRLQEIVDYEDCDEQDAPEWMKEIAKAGLGLPFDPRLDKD